MESVAITVTLSATDATCNQQNGSIRVTATGGTAPYYYSLDGTSFQDAGIFSSLAPGSYTVTVKDNGNYLGTNSLVIKAITGPNVAASCINNDGNLLITGSGGTLPYQYSLDGTNYSNTGAFGQLASGGYLAYIKDANGCINKQTTTVPLTNTLTADAGPDLILCEGKGVVLQANSNGTSFVWTPSTGLNNATVLQPSASPSVSITYFLTAMDGACQQVTSVNLIVNPAPVADAGMNDTICYGESVQLKGSGGDSYTWTPATYLNNAAIPDPLVNEPAGSITYHLVVADGKGCQSLSPASVTVQVIPPPKIFAGNDTSVLAGQPVPLYVQDLNNSGFTQYTWSPAEGLNNPAIRDPIAVLQDNITYSVTANSPGGCSAEGSISIKVFSVSDIFVPTGFTPNGDGHNDKLRAIPVGIKDFKYFAVYSRWGQRLFYTTDPAIGWDGIVNGKMAETGAYVWMTGGVDYKGQWIVRKGTVVLIR